MGLTSSQDNHALSTSFVRHNLLCLSQRRQRTRLSHCFSFLWKAFFAPGNSRADEYPAPSDDLGDSIVRGQMAH
jgi:hypothetical protein